MARSLYTFSIEDAAKAIKDGGLVAFPTETVYGLGADVFNEKGLKRIFETKGRPADNPLIVHIADKKQLSVVASEVSATAQKLVNTFFPGPLTLVLPVASNIPSIVTAGLKTVGVRMPANDITLKFLNECGTPVAAPSANLSGRPSPTTWKAVAEDLEVRLDEKTDCVLKGEAAQYGLESTVVDCTSEPAVVLRTGAVTIEELRMVVPDIISGAGNSSASDVPKSPGMKHRHYSPTAKVVLVNDLTSFIDPETTAFIGVEMPPEDFAFVKICFSADAYARSLFDFFRECDKRGIATIYCQAIGDEGIGAAVMDRIRRAAE